MIVMGVGTHRTGSSMVSEILMKLGVNMGSRLDQYNEDLDFQELNIEMVGLMGGVAIKDFRDKQALYKNYREGILELAEARNDDYCWGWKDPRNCFTVPIYHILLDHIKYIRTIRDRGEVICSLRSRGGLEHMTDEEIGIYVYDYAVDAVDWFIFEYNIRDRLVLEVDYNSVLENPADEVARIADFLDMYSDQDVIDSAIAVVNPSRKSSGL